MAAQIASPVPTLPGPPHSPMRLSLRAARAAATVLSAIALATCADSPTGPGAGRQARLAIAPVFSQAALQAAAELQSAGIQVASLKLMLFRKATGELLVEQVVDVAPGDTVTLEADVTLKETEELLKARLQFRDAAGTVLYEGEQVITARQGTSTPTNVSETLIEYVGPGKDAASLSIVPADTTISASTAITLVATAKDSAGAVIASPLIVWSSSDSALAAVSAAGVVTPAGSAGVVQIVASIPTRATATSTIRLVAGSGAVTMTKVGGDAQADTIDAVLAATPMVVELRDAVGAPMPNQVVVWRVLPTAVDSAGEYPNAGLLADASLPAAELPWYQDSLATTTDAQGRTRMYAHLGWKAGPARISAVAVGQPGGVEFTHTVRPGAPVWVMTLAQPDTMRAGIPADSMIRVQVADSYDNAVPAANVGITIHPWWYADYPALRAQPAALVAAGEATDRPTRRVLRPRHGTDTASALTASLTTPLTTGSAGLNAAQPVLNGATAVTDSAGTATFAGFTIGDVAGWYELEFEAATLGIWGWANTDVRLLAGTLAALRVRVEGDSSKAAPGDTVTVQAWLADAWENTIGTDSATRTVTWSATGGSFAPAGGTATSVMTNGHASTTWITPATAGSTDSVSASTPGLPGEPTTLSGSSQAVTIAQATPTGLVYADVTPEGAGHRQVLVLGDTQPAPLRAKLLDGAGAPIANTAIEWRQWSGSAYTTIDTTMTDAAGIATLQPVLPADSADYGYLYEAWVAGGTELMLPFQVAVRPDSTFDRVWLGAVTDGSTSIGDWAVASNWYGGVPTSTSKVLFPYWTYHVTAPRLASDATVGSIVASSAYYTATVDLGGATLTVTGDLSAPMVTGAGTIRMTGTGRTAYLYADAAAFEVAANASVNVVNYVHAQHVYLHGSLTTPAGEYVGLLGGNFTVGSTGQLNLLGGGAVLNAASVLFDDGSTGRTENGYVSFTQSFEQRATSTVAIDSAFVLAASFEDAGVHSITLANPAMPVGSVYLSGPGAATGIPTVNFSGPVRILDQLQAVEVSVTADSIQVGGYVYADSLSGFGGVRVLDFSGTTVPFFEGVPPKTVNLNSDAWLWGVSNFDTLQVRSGLYMNGLSMKVGTLNVVGEAAALHMQSAADSATVLGAARFAGGAAPSSLMQGTLILHGDLLQQNPDQMSPDGFRPDSLFDVVFRGQSQRIRFDNPGDPAAGAGSYLGRARVDSGASVIQSSTMYVTNRLEVRGDWIADPSDVNQVLLLDIAPGAGLRVEGKATLSRLNLNEGARAELVSPGTLTAAQCFNGGAELIGLSLNCTSTTPLTGGVLALLGSASPVGAPLLLVASAPADVRRRG